MKNETEKLIMEVGVLVVYDSACAGKCAKELCDRVQWHLGSEYELSISPWNLAALQIPVVAQAAAEAATQPGLLIIAVNGNDPLPPFVRIWISRHARKTRVTERAIVALFYDIIRMGLPLAPAYGDLKQIADEAGVDFFSEVVEMTDSDFDSRMNEIHERANLRVSVLDAILQRRCSSTQTA